MNRLQRLLLALGCAAGLTLTWAQTDSLAAVAPADTVLALSITAGDEISMDDFHDAFAELDLESARDALEHIRAYITDSDMLSQMDSDTAELVSLLLDILLEQQDFESKLRQYFPDTTGETLEDTCPELAALDLAESAIIGDEALLTLATSSYNPMPSTTALTRFSGAQLELMKDVHTAMVGCLAESMDEEEYLILEQDGTTLHVIGDGSDFPLILGQHDDVFMIGTNPEDLRSVVRRMEGSDEASYADSELFARQAPLTEGKGMRLAVDFAALSQLAENFRLFFADDEASTYLLERGIAVLTTLNSTSAQVVLTEDGVLVEDIVAVNPEGGDPELAELMLCDDCTVSLPDFIPSQSIAASAQYLAVQPFLDYVQGWLNGLNAITGEDMHISDVEDFFGIDPELLLGDWLGEEVISVQLEPLGMSLASMVYNPQSAYMIEVRDQDKAEEARAAWGELMGDIFEAINSFNDDVNDDLFSNLFYGESSVAHEQSRYRGYTLNRYRQSLNTDFTTFYLERDAKTYLVIASPLDTAKQLIDLLEDGEALGDSEGSRLLAGVAPDQVNALAYSNTRANSRIWQEIAETLSQPTAYGIHTGMAFLQGANYYDGMRSYNDDVYSSFQGDIDSLETRTLDLRNEPSLSIEGDLQPTDTDDEEQAAMQQYYLLELEALEEGEQVVVTLESDRFDTYLNLFDADSGSLLMSNDDFQSITRSRLVFAPEQGVRYLVEVSAFNNTEGGDYRLELRLADAMDVAEIESLATAQATMMLSQEAIDLPDIDSSLSLGETVETTMQGSFYLLDNLPTGELISVLVQASSMDSYLRLVDADSGEVIAENDDFDGDVSRSVISFEPQEGIRYAIQVTSFAQAQEETGYRVSLEQGRIESSFRDENINADYTNLPDEDDWLALALDDTARGRIVAEVDNAIAEGYSDFYRLRGLPSDQEIVVRLESDDFDTRVLVLAESYGDYIAENDDYAMNSNSQLSFYSETEETYIIEVSSFVGEGSGNYTLTIELADTEMTMETTEPLSFTEWLAITDLGHESLAILHERLSYSDSYATIRDDDIYRRLLIRVDW